MSETTRTVTIPHLGRIEGHGGITVRIVNDAVDEVNMDIFEGSRFYEALLVGKHFLEVQGIITRVCAICSASHTTVALTALEQALGIEPSERVKSLRGLLVIGSTIESHALHVFALSLPDLLGYDSVIAMARDHPREVKFALQLKELGNRIQDLVGGRAVHPVNTLVGGFGKLPRAEDLLAVRERLTAALDPLLEFVDLAAGIPLPAHPGGAPVYLALEPHEPGYRFRGNVLRTSRGERFPLSAYREVVREYSVEHSHAKHAALAGGERYVVGALARLKLWGDRLEGRAREARDRLFPEGIPDNILYNNWAQLVELVHAVERAATVAGRMAEMPPEERDVREYGVRAGRGTGAIEAPRGTLIHEYELDRDGRVVSANVITPTAQNLASAEVDLRRGVERLLGAASPPTDAALKFNLEMLARAYDPCISCSVHVTRVSDPG